jgi:hypothetical protein
MVIIIVVVEQEDLSRLHYWCADVRTFSNAVIVFNFLISLAVLV